MSALLYKFGFPSCRCHPSIHSSFLLFLFGPLLLLYEASIFSFLLNRHHVCFTMVRGPAGAVCRQLCDIIADRREQEERRKAKRSVSYRFLSIILLSMGTTSYCLCVICFRYLYPYITALAASLFQSLLLVSFRFGFIPCPFTYQPRPLIMSPFFLCL